MKKDVKAKDDDWSNKYKVNEDKKSASQKFDEPIKIDSAANYDPSAPV